VVAVADIPVIETARLRLRAYRIEDFDGYAAVFSDPELVRFISRVPFTREACWSRFLRDVGIWHYLGFGAFAVEERATGAFVGHCGFHDLRRDTSPSIAGTMESGWALLAQFHGQGYAAEAMGAAIDWAEHNHPNARLTALIHPDNTASLRLATRLGYAEFARSTLSGEPAILLERRVARP
jgi:RimJ/RimL family protein N-acetyltransferase